MPRLSFSREGTEVESTSPRSLVLLIGLVVIGGGYVGYEYVYKPKAAEIEALESRLENLETENGTARILSEQNGQEAVESRLATYREQLMLLERLVPSSEEVPDLLDAIATEAGRTGVELTLIQPVSAVAETYYTRRTYDLGAIGAYHAIGAFITRIGSLSRIVTPLSLNLALLSEETQSGDPELEARFTIETYVLPPTYGVTDGSSDQ